MSLLESQINLEGKMKYYIQVLNAGLQNEQHACAKTYNFESILHLMAA
jgi:hypothetical protein